MRMLALCCAFGLSAGALLAQTMVEAAILTGATATGAAAKGGGIGASIGNVFGKVGGTLAGAAGATSSGAPARTSSSKAARPSAPEPPLPKPSKTDFEGVETGMPREQLLAKVGKPRFSLSMAEQGRLEEVMRYTTKEGSSARVKVTDGKVSSIEWSEPN
ncbi:MAG: hypothetical protein Q8N47_21630 [Bryobacterales bacterium]|nr:hypothetical protein [Bryobacterales bacterium]